MPTAVTAGRRIGMRDLLEIVEAERVRADEEITEAERLLFEQALTGDTRRHLSATIRDAHDLVDRMNERLATVRTASDVRVRLRWEVRDEEGGSLRHAQALLLKDPARLAEEERARSARVLPRRGSTRRTPTTSGGAGPSSSLRSSTTRRGTSSGSRCTAVTTRAGGR